MSDALTPRVRKFVAEYLIDGNGAAAVKRAGYKQNAAAAAVTASRLLRTAKVKALLAIQSEKIEERTLVTAEFVINSLKEIVQRTMQRVPVMVQIGNHKMQMKDADGHGVWTFDASGANRSLELLGKHLALFTEKHELTGADGQPIILQWEGAGK